MSTFLPHPKLTAIKYANRAAELYNHAPNAALRGMPQVCAIALNWNKPALNARIAYQLGEVETAKVIVRNVLEEIAAWLPTELKVFALMLYQARFKFYCGDLNAAEACYQWTYELITKYDMEDVLGSIAAEVYDEWGECLTLLGFSDEAWERYQRAVSIDLECHSNDPRLMSPWRLAKLADFFAIRGNLTDATLCLQLAETRAVSPVEKMFIRTYCVADRNWAC